jgi:hypothetical protein
MVGIGLGRLWDTHPRVAFVLHLGITVMLGAFAVSFVWSGNNWTLSVVLTIGFLVMAAVLAFFTWAAIQDGWSRSD